MKHTASRQKWLNRAEEAVETRSDTSTPAGLRTKRQSQSWIAKSAMGDIFSWVRVSPGHPHHRHLSITGWTVIDSSALQGAWECYIPPQPYSRHYSSNSFCCKGIVFLLGLIFFSFFNSQFPFSQNWGTILDKGCWRAPKHVWVWKGSHATSTAGTVSLNSTEQSIHVYYAGLKTK